MNRGPTLSLVAALLPIVCALPAHAGRVRTIAFVPDPSCRSSKLVGSVEEALEINLKVKRVRVVKEDKSAAHILLQYFLLVRRDGDRIILTPKPLTWDDYFAAAHRLSDDFPDHIEDLPPQERESL